jgi:hypothetical protein
VSRATVGGAQLKTAARPEPPPVGAPPSCAAPPERTSALDEAPAPSSGSEGAQRAPTPRMPWGTPAVAREALASSDAFTMSSAEPSSDSMAAIKWLAVLNTCSRRVRRPRALALAGSAASCLVCHVHAAVSAQLPVVRQLPAARDAHAGRLLARPIAAVARSLEFSVCGLHERPAARDAPCALRPGHTGQAGWDERAAACGRGHHRPRWTRTTAPFQERYSGDVARRARATLPGRLPWFA